MDTHKALNSLNEIKSYLIKCADSNERVKSLGVIESFLRTTLPKNSIESLSKDDPVKTLLLSDTWPGAIPQVMLCSSESDKNERASGIMAWLPKIVIGKSFLDFGCGEGHCIKTALKEGASCAVGYDINQQGQLTWESSPLITTDFAKVQQNAPYDIILLYDVLDHAKDPIDVLKKVKTVSTDKTSIFVKCHPWCSIHGGHLCHKLNKAFAHLVLSESDLESYEMIWTNRITHPLSTYKKWFADTNLKVINEVQDNQELISFFTENKIAKKALQANWKNSPISKLAKEVEFPWQLKLRFVDYTLQKQV